MLVKFGKVGKPITEYLMEDNSTLEDLLDVVNVELEEDDIVQRIFDGTKVILDDLEENLKDNATYILERIEFTPQEEKILDIINDEWDNDMSTLEKKEFIKKLMFYGWDK